MKRTVFNNFYEPRVVANNNWIGNIAISKGEKTETQTYKVENSSRIKAKNQLQDIAKRVNGELVYMNAI